MTAPPDPPPLAAAILCPQCHGTGVEREAPGSLPDVPCGATTEGCAGLGSVGVTVSGYLVPLTWRADL